MRLISLQYTQKMCQRYKQSSGLYLQGPFYIYKSLTSPIFEGTYNMLVSIHSNEFQKMSEARRTESAANKISAIAEQTDDNFSSYHSRKIQIGEHMIPFYVEFDIFNK